MDGKFKSLNFYIKEDSLDYDIYEFEGGDLYVEELDDEVTLFALNIEKSTGREEVHVAYSQDFDVMEDVTHLFDIEELKKDIRYYIDNNKVYNLADVYIKYLQYKEDGYEATHATVMAYSALIED